MTRRSTFFLPPLWVWALVGALFLGILWSVQGILMPFFVSFIVSYILNPLTEKFQLYKIPRSVSSLVLVLAFFAAILLGIMFSLPFLKEELLRLAYALPRYGTQVYNMISPYVDQLKSALNVTDASALDEKLSPQIGAMVSWTLRALAGLFSNTLALANMFSLIVLTPIITFYFLRDWPHMRTSFQNLLPKKYSPRVLYLIENIDRTLGGYFRGQAIVCVTLFLFYALFLSLVGLNFSLTIASITGFFAFVPYVGYLVGILSAMGVAFSQFTEWLPIVTVLVIFIIGQVIESMVLLPNIVGDRIGLHPVWIIFALLAGGLLMGFVGLLLAMPIAATLGVLVRFILDEYRKSVYYS